MQRFITGMLLIVAYSIVSSMLDFPPWTAAVAGAIIAITTDMWSFLFKQ